MFKVRAEGAAGVLPAAGYLEREHGHRGPTVTPSMRRKVFEWSLRVADTLRLPDTALHLAGMLTQLGTKGAAPGPLGLTIP